MSVVLDTCVLVDFYDEKTKKRLKTQSRKEALGRILEDHDGLMSSACAIEALYYLSKYTDDTSYNLLLNHIVRKSEICTVVDPASDLRILKKAAELYELGLTIEVIMNAAIAIIYECPIVTAIMPLGSEPDDYAVIENLDLCVVQRI